MTRRPFSLVRPIAGLALTVGALTSFATEASAQGGGRGGMSLPRLTTAPPAASGWGATPAAPSMPAMAPTRGGYITSPGTSSGPGGYSRRGDLPRITTARPGYGAYGRGYGTSSGTTGSSRYWRAPYTRWGSGSGCRDGCVTGGHVRRYNKSYIIGYPLFGVPIFYPYYDVGYVYSEVAADTYAPEPSRATSKLIVVGTGSGGGSDALTVESLGDSVRLNWLPNGRPVREVKLFVADSGKRELATRSTNPVTPTAIFEIATLSAPVAFVGVTVVFADGVTSTTLVPYRGDAAASRPR